MKKSFIPIILTVILFFTAVASAFANEGNLVLTDFKSVNFPRLFGWNGHQVLLYGSFVIILIIILSLIMNNNVSKKLSHYSMLEQGNIIYQSAKAYLKQQGKLLMILFPILLLPGIVNLIVNDSSYFSILLVVLYSFLGVYGSYFQAKYGVRLNTKANSRTAFAALKRKPLDVVSIPVESGMSIGLMLISSELLIMVSILLFVPSTSAFPCFIGFAIGESLGASALRIIGGIFTKIADIASDLLKIIFGIKEDDPRNPGVIADCVGDNAGDQVGPTADAFETYGVTGVALITYITLAVPDPKVQAMLIVAIIAQRYLNDLSAGIAYYINKIYSSIRYKNSEQISYQGYLTRLNWIGGFSSMIVSYIVGSVILYDLPYHLWLKIPTIINIGIFAAIAIPEMTKLSVSTKSKHVLEIVASAREGGSSLAILSATVAGYFSAFWKGMFIVLLMLCGVAITNTPGFEMFAYPSVFACGLMAYGLLSMGAITIASDAYGPAADNAGSIYELSQIENIPNIEQEIEQDFGFTPDFVNAKKQLQLNDANGNTFKATAKPVLIATSVMGATTLIFSIILLFESKGLLDLRLTNPYVICGLTAGGAVIFWFSGASIQAVTAGTHKAVKFIKKTFSLSSVRATLEDSKKVVTICTKFAQKGGINILGAMFCASSAFAYFNPNFFVSYLIALAIFGLFQAVYMANAGGAADNAKKVVEDDSANLNTELHHAVVAADTWGDPNKDTSSVAINPHIKFQTLYGINNAELSVMLFVSGFSAISSVIAGIFFLGFLIFTWRSFYSMLITEKEVEQVTPKYSVLAPKGVYAKK